MRKVKTKRNLTRKRVICGMILCLLIIVPIFLVCGNFLTSKKPKFIFETKPNSSVALSNEIVICNAEGTQSYIEISNDGFGGAIITWRDTRDGNGDIYGQKVNSSGIIQWGANGTAICNIPEDQLAPNIIADREGGAIIVWKDRRDGISEDDIYAQRIDSDGIIQWETNGTVICNANNAQNNPMIISDGNGGAIIAWGDNRDGDDIYAQRIDQSGITQWEANGTVIYDGSNLPFNPTIVSDGNGGAIIAWVDDREGSSDYDIYSQKVDSSGIPQWKANGTVICNASGSQFPPQIINFEGEGTIFAWRDIRTGFQDIYAQKVNSLGAFQWAPNGIVICNANDYQNRPRAISDGEEGAILTWNDNRAGIQNIYAQRIDPEGTIQWEGNGSIVCNAIGAQKEPELINDGVGGGILTWIDERKGSTNDDIYAQRIRSDGTIQWEGNGTLICNATGIQEDPRIIKSGNEKAIIVWKDQRNGEVDIYARLISYDTDGKKTALAIPGFNPLLIIGMIALCSAMMICTKVFKIRKIKE